MAKKMKNLLNKIAYWSPTWASLVPIQLSAIYALYLIFTGQAIAYWYIATLLGFCCYQVLGISVCYHRLLAHRSFKTTRLRKIFLLTCATLAGQYSPFFWVCIHRGIHHRTADTENDIHSPRHGFWHSYFLWMYRLKKGDLNPKYVPDLLRDKDVVFFHKHYMKLYAAMNIAIMLSFGFTAWLFIVALPAALTFHSYATNTSFTHMKNLGYRNFDTKDNSVNVAWIWPISLGESWHNNHHAMPGSSNFGSKWYEIDPSYWIIKLIKI